MKIFINPGHGESDTGACGNGLIERDVNLTIAKLTAKYLQAVNYDTKICQRNDLEFICNARNDWQADLFISIHCNAGGGIGTETYYFYGSTTGRNLAHRIHTRLVDTLHLVDRGIKQAGFYVLNGTDCPAALIETAFIDNEFDADLLAHCADDIAKAIACGVNDYFI